MAAWALWVVPMLVIGVLVVLHPMRDTVTLGSYHPAAAHWWSREGLYVGPGGMNYLPVFAVLFTPFHFLPLWLGEALWRFCNAATLAVGLWQLTRALFGTDWEKAFLWATVITMPLCMTSLRFGNANAIFGGTALLSVAALLNRRWGLACALMALTTAIKPLGIVLMLLRPTGLQALALAHAAGIHRAGNLPFSIRATRLRMGAASRRLD